jgi:hypothetical protein
VTLRGWLVHLFDRWRRDAGAAARPLSGPREIDIDLTRSDAAPPGESTDYDVHSLGEPIEPPTAVRRAGR